MVTLPSQLPLLLHRHLAQRVIERFFSIPRSSSRTCPICKLDVIEAQKASCMRGESCRGRSNFEHHDGTRDNARQYRAGRGLSADHFTPTANGQCESRRLLTLRGSIGW